MTKIFKIIISELTYEQKKYGIFLLVLMIGGMVFETIGVGLIIPVFTTLSNQAQIHTLPYIKYFDKYFIHLNTTQIIIYVMVFMTIIYLIKNIYLGFLTWAQFRYSNLIQVHLSQKLFKIYLSQPYTFHLKKNSAQLLRNIMVEISQYQAAITQVMTLFTEILVIIGITTLLIYTEPLGSILVLIVLLVLAMSFNFFTKKKVLIWGENRLYHEGQINQHLMQGLAGVKEVKIFGREKEFLNIFKKHLSKRQRLNLLYSVISSLPKLWLEFIGILALSLLVIVMIINGKPIVDILPTVTLFAAASFRLMPSINKILNSFQGLNYTKASVLMISEELKFMSNESDKLLYKPDIINLDFQSEISISNLSFYYPDTDIPALDNISFKIKVGQSIGIIGASGSGKSTLVDLILGLLQPQDGGIYLNSNNINKSNQFLRGWQNLIGYVNQTIYLTDDTLRNNIAFGIDKSEIDEKKINFAIKAAQLSEFIDALPLGIDTIVGERGVRLSGGQRQRIGIARALYNDPPILVLDEATSALDTNTELQVMDSIKLLEEKTIIIIAHRYSTIEHCDWIIKLNHGKLVEVGLSKNLLT